MGVISSLRRQKGHHCRFPLIQLFSPDFLSAISLQGFTVSLSLMERHWKAEQANPEKAESLVRLEK